MKTFKRTFEKKTLPIVESLKRELLRDYDAILIDKIRRDAITLRRLYECEMQRLYSREIRRRILD